MLHDIQTPIADDLRRYADVFRQSLRADNELLAAALAHVTRRLGKMMRPTLVLLCARQGANGVTLEAAVSSPDLNIIADAGDITATAAARATATLPLKRSANAAEAAKTAYAGIDDRTRTGMSLAARCPSRRYIEPANANISARRFADMANLTRQNLFSKAPKTSGSTIADMAQALDALK